MKPFKCFILFSNFLSSHAPKESKGCPLPEADPCAPERGHRTYSLGSLNPHLISPSFCSARINVAVREQVLPTTLIPTIDLILPPTADTFPHSCQMFFFRKFRLFREQFLVSFLMTFWTILGFIFDPFSIIFASFSGTFRHSDFVSIFKWFLTRLGSPHAARGHLRHLETILKLSQANFTPS